jgi:hypothetical protein
MSAADRLRSAVTAGDFVEARAALFDFADALSQQAAVLAPDDPRWPKLQRDAGDLLHWCLQIATADRAQCLDALAALPQPGGYARPQTATETWSLDA